MSSLFHEAKAQAYRAIRAASQGASVSLLRGAGDYVATFGCATAVASLLGDRALCLADKVPEYRIPIVEMASACAKLAQRFSIALVDVGMVNYEIQFVLLWKIPAIPQELKSVTTNIDDY